MSTTIDNTPSAETHDLITTSTGVPRAMRTELAPSSPEAIDRAKADAALIFEKDFEPIRVDVTDSTYGVLACVPSLERLRGPIVATFGEEGTRALDGLVPAARVLLDAQARYAAESDPDFEIAEKFLRERRELLFTLASAGIKRGVGDKRSLSRLVGGQSYAALADDTRLLVAWIRTNEAELAPHSKLTTAQLDEIDRRVEGFAYGAKLRGKTTSVAAVDRARAFTHFVRVWDDVRRLVTFQRWHERDYDAIAPSIYAGRTRRGESDATPPVPNNVRPGMPGAPPFAPST